jgi:N-methylhydantoinase A
MTLRLATDIGGTFTDLVGFDEESGALTVGKAPTTPADLPRGVLDAVAVAQVSLEEVTELAHGTTVVINALTERRGARTALVTTKGFRDVLEIGRGNRPDMYNLVSRKPPPFVPRRHRFEVRERVDRHGNVLTALELGDLEPVIDACRRDGIEAVAVCLLHSYAHPAHEQALREALLDALPEVPVTISSEITREWREYERSSTAVLNAYVQPTVERYLAALEHQLAEDGLRGPVRIVQSNGGTSSLRAARSSPIRLVESGPAAGVIGAARLGERIGEPNVLYLDIGGTTAKCSLIENGEPKTTTEYRIEWRPDYAGYPIMVPVVDIVEIGAGGGSIAWIDEGGSVRVGPRSAGADPGPACYGRGGAQPTCTDANLVLGYLSAGFFAGGRMKLDPEAAKSAIGERIGKRLGMDVVEAAHGMYQVINVNMASAIREISVQKGYDPREFPLICAGGAGPIHGAAIAAELGIRRLVVPRDSSIFCAAGMLRTDLKHDFVRSCARVLPHGKDARVKALLAEMLREARATLKAEGIASAAQRFLYSMDLRYLGQYHEVNVGVPPERLEDWKAIRELFHDRHDALYGYSLREERTPVELLNLRLTAIGATRKPTLKREPRRSASCQKAFKGRRNAYLGERFVTVPVYDGERLGHGNRLAGPAIIESINTTVVVPRGWRAQYDALGSCVLTR